MGKDSRSIVSNVGWSVVERLCSQVVLFVVSVILARLIVPEVYGIATVVTVIVNILAVVLPSGFSSALIYSKMDDVRCYSTAFWATLILTLVLYSVLFISAPLLADYYSAEEITVYVRITAIQLILQGIQSIPFAYISKKMLFRENYKATLVGVIASALVSISLAVFGLGVWALLLSVSIQTAVSTIVLCRAINFRVELRMDLGIAKEMFLYCWKLMGVDFLNSLYSSLNSLIIGKLFQKTEVAFYTRAYNLPQMLLGSVTTAVSKVLFPVFSERNESVDCVRLMLRKSVRLMNYTVYPLLGALGAMGYEIVVVLYTEQWVGVVPYLYVMCFVWAFQPVQTCAIQAFKALGKTGIFLKLEILKKLAGLIIIAGFVYFMGDPMALAFSLLASQVISSLINMPLLKKHLGYSYGDQVKDMIESLPVSLLMICGIRGAAMLVGNLAMRIPLQILIGAGIYSLLSWLIKSENFFYLKDVALEIVGRKIR
ncbi:lipopolysaccharide biosynthesis protein [Adlercreutzia faecimuris]|uniref:Lipopolysaccharide biosynthesis protein n=1 Tax=Adlercreutzia faecimuris TaxID=2897341 RepID=A0ABS9WJR9_9ACTN|nr:lipopolysaccharide biosynthesis protein [Adlercreutzia sp. JBNU-10]MCI2242820.1 lipopolysaccharide biosynthesis protein [Adlercreutzia sp. JBNU-10]